jgi:hypothetical protein
LKKETYLVRRRKGNSMRKLVLALFVTGALAAGSLAGTETYSSKEMKQVAPVPPPCPEWYADNEWNVSLWGTYAFSGTDNQRESITDMFFVPLVNESPGRYDRFLGDHAWGGGVDAKYFFRRYFGVGIEGFGLDAHQGSYHFTDFGFGDFSRGTDHNAVGGVLGTLTLRYPIPCTRFSPYVWAGGGGVFGGENQRPIRGLFRGIAYTENVTHDSDSRGLGQFGGGMEVRITPHIGWISDFSWNVVDGPHNNFGMARTGINFAF